MKVLVVDDQELNRSLLKHMLEHEGFTVVLAENGIEAISVFKQESPDLVLLDVVMPILDGYSTAPKLKELSKEVYLPIIFITALDDQDSLKHCLEVGGDDFLNKPFDRVILQAKIQAHSRIRALSIKTFEQKKQLDFYRLKTEREHQIVEHIFNRALEGNYKVPHLLEYHLSPASMFNGDIMLVALGPTGNLYVMMGDFTGHGLSSAVGTLPVSRTFYSMTQKGLSVGDIACEINDILLTLLPDDMFCAAALIELSSQGKSLSIWAGGTPDMYLVDDLSGIKQTIASQHMALGILDNVEFDLAVENYSVSVSDKLYMATDGVVESFNQNQEMFGYDRLEHLINDVNNNSIAQIVDSLNEFRGEAEQDDDISILSLRCAAINSNEDEWDNHFSTLPLVINLDLNVEQIKSTDPVAEVVDLIAQIKGAGLHRSTLFLLLSEAYNNAVDHGLLGLDSKIKDTDDGFMEYYSLRIERLERLNEGQIKIAINYEPAECSVHIIVTDSGDGFIAEDNDFDFECELEHGRGNMLLHELAEFVNYNEKGNQVHVAYKLNSPIRSIN
ncbi:fused response regulator/phosphatase [Psychrosphaera sp. B3R10]|uniref:ATP-binding SpoIIE family protein phosphatase n=1 Tax=unclassified Psychrosphaera TaxID=2641570 RepID=UPI001C095FFF|nr:MULTISPECIES: fused response regulator/phosphatase [unclassified Psychrosphaera]MBU2881553.1 fused response regulator/phosphatase [Psychrosphaera sp. I2R16]MBU2991192.1 fused response regulator/phosphatase [Psychrosphaera sp. B3R10]MDO6719477.1 fused response regulator/phosphatase [Psychrosphaera sp. 1_MG-2023]